MTINHWSYKKNNWLPGRCKSFEEESEEQEKDRVLGNTYSFEGQEREEFSPIFQDLTTLSFKLLAFKLKKKNLSPVDYSWNVLGGIEMQSYLLGGGKGWCDFNLLSKLLQWQLYEYVLNK